MKIFSSLKIGFSRTLTAWKSVLIVWLLMFLLVTLYIYPLRSSLGTSFGSSMITEKLNAGIDIEVFSDLGPVIRSMISALTTGFIIVLIAGTILNAFLTGGLFGIVRKDNVRFASGEFFRSGAQNFWSFLIISLIVSVIRSVSGTVIVGIPLLISTTSDSLSEKTAFMIPMIALMVYILILPLFLLIADYARAWKASNENASCFRALGFGFSNTFSRFRSSYLLMALLLAAQIILGTIAVLTIPAWKPVTVGGVFLMLIISQLIIYIRLMFKTWRYASVTVLMEKTSIVGLKEELNPVPDEKE